MKLKPKNPVESESVMWPYNVGVRYLSPQDAIKTIFNLDILSLLVFFG